MSARLPPFHLPVDPTTELRLVRVRDAERLFELVDANRAHLRPWMPWVDATRTAADTERFIRAARRAYADGDAITAVIARYGEPVGVADLQAIDRANRSASIGYWIAADAQGDGVVTRSVAALVAYAFDALDLYRVQIRAAVHNARSRRVAERLGFREEGVHRAAQWVDGRAVDLVAYAVLRPEWPPAPEVNRP